MQPSRKIIPIENLDLAVQITDDQSRTLIFPDSDVAYHSRSGASTETRHVYLNNSGVADRLSARRPTSVLEIGLGIGMGMLLTLDRALADAAPLQYTAVESRLLGVEVLRRLNLAELVADHSLVERFLAWRDELGEPPLGGHYRWDPTDQHHVVVAHQDALDWTPLESGYDAIYFDPFAPDTNSRLWTPEFLSKMRRLLAADGRLVTYCVSRAVRDAFAAAGFSVDRVRGPVGGKREVLVATIRAATD